MTNDKTVKAYHKAAIKPYLQQFYRGNRLAFASARGRSTAYRLLADRPGTLCLPEK